MNLQDDEDKLSHYRYFYLNARSELLCICRLSEEKSLNKVLNCILYATYMEKDLFDDNNAKNILWNCFGEELVERAKCNYPDKEISFDDADKKLEKIKQKRKKLLSKIPEENDSFEIRELDNSRKSPSTIIIKDSDIKSINQCLSKEILDKKEISSKDAPALKKLYSSLTIINKSLEYDVCIKSKTAHRKPPVKIISNRNNGIQFF